MNKLIVLVVLGLSLAASAQAQQITGTITSSQDGLPLPGTHIFLANRILGTTSDADGSYLLSIPAPGTYTIFFSFTGYHNQEISVTLSEGEQQELNIALIQGIELDPVQITAGRRQEKILDSPASIDVLTAKDLLHETAPSTISALRNTMGVDIAQTGIDRHEVVLRGFNNSFSGAAYILTDYRHAGVPSLDVNLHSVMPNMDIDIERIEVVRGPGSALYGAGVSDGVIHYISKDPFSYPGITFSVGGGEQSMRDLQGRIAGVIGGKLGYKITSAYTSATEFELESCSQELLEAQRFDECPDPLDAQQIAFDGIRDTQFQKFNVNSSLEYRFTPKTSLILNAGHSQFTGTLLSPIGTIQGNQYGYTYGQLRFRSGRFFAQAYVNQNLGDDSYVYGGDRLPVVEESKLYNMQAQYGLGAAGGKQEFIFGADLELTRPNTVGTILGRNDDNDNLNEYGAYAQSTTKLSDKFELTLVARGDYNNIVKVLQFSPRAALVFKPAPAHSIRTTFNQSFATPNSNTAFLDIVAARIPGTDVLIRARGAAHGFTWDRNPEYLERGAPTDLVASSLIPQYIGQPTPVGLETGLMYGLLYEGLAATPIEDIIGFISQLGIPANEATARLMVDLLHPDQLNVNGFSPGVMGLYDITSQELLSSPEDLVPIDPLRLTTSRTFEIGYKGILSDKVLLTVDGYFVQRRNFIAPLRLETPLVLIPSLQEDLTRDIAAGIAGNALLAGTVALFGLAAEDVAELLIGLAADSGSLPDATTPLAVVQTIENNPGVGLTPELMLTYRSFGKLNYYGVDAAVQIIASDNLQLFGNISWIKDDFFDHRELEVDNENLSVALNAPTVKIKMGGTYTHASGLSINASGRYTKGFPVNSGVYVGTVDDYFILDLGVGYAFRNSFDGLRATLGIANALDGNHREFIGAPKLRRVAIGRITYTFNFYN